MKKLFGVFTVGLLCAVSNFPLYAGKLDPQVIFEEEKRGLATCPEKTTKAAALHEEGIKGQGLKAAIIDQGFFPDYTEELRDLIDPVAFSENLIYHSTEECKSFNIHTLLCLTDRLKNQVSIDNAQKIKKYENIINRKCFNLDENTNSHGSMVMETLHLIAPESKFLPIDIHSYGPNRGRVSDDLVAYGIRKAIEYGADVINMSILITNYSDQIVEACQEARRKDIPIIFSAGNDSQKNFPVFLYEDGYQDTNTLKNNYKIDLFDALQGKGVWFAGALKYKKDGEETLTYYTQHPVERTKNHFICAAGCKIPVHAPPASLWGCGTSAAVPIVTGGYLLLKEFARAKGYTLSSQEILDIMYESGRDVVHSFRNSIRTDIQLPEEVVYKSLDLEKAKKKIEEKFKKNVINQTSEIVVGPRRALPPIPSKAAAPMVKTPPVAPQGVAPVAAVKVAPKSITPAKKYPPVNTGRTLK